MMIDVEKIIAIANEQENTLFDKKEKQRRILEIIKNAKELKLNDLLTDWVDGDGAMHYLGCMLGIFEHSQEDWFENKWIFWTSNRLSDMLTDLLQILVENKIVLFREDEVQYRFNPQWKKASQDLSRQRETLGEAIMRILGIKETDPERKETMERLLDIHIRNVILGVKKDE